jgi:hypothetical protein
LAPSTCFISKNSSAKRTVKKRLQSHSTLVDQSTLFTIPKTLLCENYSLGLIVFTLLTYSCRKTDWESGINNDRFPGKGKRIHVSNVESFYNAINDPANEGGTIVLAPGTYALNSNFPKNGRIELAHNMSLVGKPGDANAVVIDVTGLPASAYVVPPTATYPFQLRTGPIRIGNGYNAIEWLTIKNNPQNIIRSMIQTDIVAKQNATDPAPPVQVRIAHTIIKGSSIGINIINRDAVSNGRIVEAEIENNEILENNIPQFGSGVQVQNSQALTGALIKVTLRGNYIHHNKNGLNILNSSSENNRIIANLLETGWKRMVLVLPYRQALIPWAVLQKETQYNLKQMAQPFETTGACRFPYPIFSRRCIYSRC